MGDINDVMSACNSFQDIIMLIRMEVKVNMDINVSAFVITIAFSIMAIEEGTKHFGDIYEHYSDGFIDKV